MEVAESDAQIILSIKEGKVLFYIYLFKLYILESKRQNLLLKSLNSNNLYVDFI